MLFRTLATTVVGAYVLLGSTLASSVQRNPINYVTIIDEPVIHTPSHRATALSSFDLTFHLHNRRQYVKLTLEPNHDAIAEGATVSYLAADGTVARTETIDRRDHKVFMGSAWLQHHDGAEWFNVGWARIMVHQDGDRPVFEGAFLMEGDNHHIQTTENYQSTKLTEDPALPNGAEHHMVLWRDSDVRGNDHLHTELKRDHSEETSTCSSDALDFNISPDHPVYTAMRRREDVSESGFWGSISTRSLFGRQIDGQTSGNSGSVNLASTIGSTVGCPATRRVALVGVATDCTYTAAFANSSAVRQNIILQMNTASVQYESSFNITLGLRNLTISDAACPASAPASAAWNVPCSGADIQQRLNVFSAWRGNLGDSNAFWTLLTTCNTQSAVGLAWLGQVCMNTVTVNGNETVSSANVVVRTPTEWQVIAHEAGHTFGAVHDCVASTCNDGRTLNAQQCCPLSAATCDAGERFLMNPSTRASITQFSACSVGNICSAIGRNSVNTACLTANRNVVTISEAQCGNGIVEEGEDCDCGGPTGCSSNSCCNPTTCRFTTNSVCDPSNEDCCTNSCQFAGNQTVCRASTGTCDPQETCPGNSALCPVNVNSPDGTSCGDSGNSLYCASGQCTSRNAQCQTLMGAIAHSNSTYACSDQGCRVSCASPAFGSNVCYSMQQNFLDGTSCSGNGRCENGQCQGSTVGGEISSWIDRNRNLVIGLSVGLGSLLILAILGCCCSSCRRRRATKSRKKIVSQPSYGGSSDNWQSQGWGPAAPPMAHTGAWGNDGRWDPNMSPPPGYTGRSERYA